MTKVATCGDRHRHRPLMAFTWERSSVGQHSPPSSGQIPILQQPPWTWRKSRLEKPCRVKWGSREHKPWKTMKNTSPFFLAFSKGEWWWTFSKGEWWWNDIKWGHQHLQIVLNPPVPAALRMFFAPVGLVHLPLGDWRRSMVQRKVCRFLACWKRGWHILWPFRSVYVAYRKYVHIYIYTHNRCVVYVIIYIILYYIILYYIILYYIILYYIILY